MLGVWTEAETGEFERTSSVKRVGGVVEELLDVSFALDSASTTDHSLLLVRFECGKLELWDASTLLLLKRWKDSVISVTLMISSGMRSVAMVLSSGQLVVEPLCLCDAETRTLVHKAVVPNSTVLPSPIPGLPGSFLIFGHYQKSNTFYGFMALQNTSQTNLNTLLASEDFNGAIALAKKESPEKVPDVHLAHLTSLLQRFDEEREEIFGEIKNVLSDLCALSSEQHTTSAVDACISVSNCCSTETYKRLLSVVGSVVGAGIVEETLKRLETYTKIAETDQMNPGTWHDFRKSPVNAILTKLLRLGRLDYVRIVAQRHDVPQMSSESLLELLQAVPFEADMDKSLQWISKDLLPLLSDANRTTLLTWARDRALELERTHGDPNGALTFCSSIIDGIAVKSPDAGLLETPSTRVKKTLSLDTREEDEDSALAVTSKGLQELAADLREVCHLKKSYGLSFSAGDLRSQGHERVVFALLDKVVAPDLLESVINTQVAEYIARHNLAMETHVDAMLLRYCADTFRDSTEASGSVCEQRVIAIYRCVRSNKVKGELLLLLIRHLLPPYSADFSECLSDEVAVEIVAEIEEQKRLMRIRTIVAKYKVDSFDFANPNHARQLVSSLSALAAGSEKNEVEILGDCITLAESYHNISVEDVYTATLQNLALLQCAPKEYGAFRQRITKLVEKVETGQTMMEVLYFCEEFLLHGAETDLFAFALVASIVGKAGLKHKSFTLEKEERRFVESLSTASTALCSLSSDFDIHVTLVQLKEQSVETFRDILSGKRFQEAELMAIGDLLQLSVDKVISELAIYSCQNGDFERCNKLFVKIDCRSVEPLTLAVESMLQMDGLNASTVHAVSRTCVSRLVLSQPRNRLCKCLELLRSSDLIGQLLELCEADNYDDIESEATATNRPPWRSWFVENANVLTAEDLVPLLKSFLLAQEGFRCSPQSNSESLLYKCNSLVDYLLKNSATQCALAVIMSLDCELLYSNRDAVARIQQLIEALANKAMKYRVVDAGLLTGYLCAVRDKAQAFTTFREELPNVQEDYERLGALAQVGVAFGTLREMQEVSHDCSNVCKNAHWWHRLTQMGVKFDVRKFTVLQDAALKDYVLEELMPLLVVNSGFDLKEAEGFGAAYGIERLYVCRVYFVLVLKADDIADYEKKLASVLPILRSEMKSLCQDVLTFVGGTDYKRLRFVYNLLLSMCACREQQTELQTRVHVLEYLMMDHNFPTAIDFNDLCAQPWKTIDAILSSRTIKRLIGLCHPLQLDPDQFYVRLIHKQQERDPRKLQLLKCIGNAKLAVETAESVAQEAKHYKHKLEVLTLGLSIAKANGYTIGESRIVPKLNAAATTLDIQDLIGEGARKACEEWVSDPSEMCCQLLNLYHGHKNVHQLTESIAERYSFDVCKLRRYIVNVWLTSLRVSSSWEESSVKEMEEQVQKIVNTLSRNSKERTITFLLTFVFKKRCIFRAKEIALSALFRLVSMQEVQSICNDKGLNLPDLRTYWQYCGYMGLFEKMGSSQNIDDLIACDKLGLVKALWRDHREDTVALRLIAMLILDFSLRDEKLVHALKKQLSKLGQETLLRQFSRTCEISQSED